MCANLARRLASFIFGVRENHDHVGTGFRIQIRSTNTFGKSIRAHGIGARRDHESGITPAANRVANLLAHFIRGNYVFLTFVVVNALGIYLVFDVDGGRTSLLQNLHRAHNVHGIAVARASVDHHWYGYSRGYSSGGGSN